MNGADFALLVGIGTYPEASELDPLKGPHNDLKRIRDWLTLPRTKGGGGVDPEDILMLTESDANGNDASKGSVYKAIWSIKAEAEKRAKEAGNPQRPWARRLYLYFAGHGVFPRPVTFMDRLEAAFLPEDWQPLWAGGYIPIYQLSLFLNQAHYFEEIVVISDACRNKLRKEVSPQNLDMPHDPDPLGGESRLLMCYAARHQEYAKEKEIGGKFLGVFSKSMSDALIGAARNGAGELTYKELRDFVDARMPVFLNENDFQHPRFEVLAMGEQIALATGDVAELEMRLKVGNGGYAEDIVLRDGDYNELARIPAGSTDAQTVKQPAGLYLLEGPGDRVRDIHNYELEGVEIEV